MILIDVGSSRVSTNMCVCLLPIEVSSNFQCYGVGLPKGLYMWE